MSVTYNLELTKEQLDVVLQAVVSVAVETDDAQEASVLEEIAGELKALKEGR